MNTIIYNKNYSLFCVKLRMRIDVSYSTVCILGIMVVLHFLYNRLVVLVRHSQAQKCLQINAKPFQQVVMKF